MVSLWQGIRDHLYSLIVAPDEYSLLVERAVVGILRLAIRLLRRDDVALQVRAHPCRVSNYFQKNKVYCNILTPNLNSVCDIR